MPATPSPFIQLTDMEYTSRKNPDGQKVHVRRDAIVALRPYSPPVRGINCIVSTTAGLHLHAGETRDEILAKIT